MAHCRSFTFKYKRRPRSAAAPHLFPSRWGRIHPGTSVRVVNIRTLRRMNATMRPFPPHEASCFCKIADHPIIDRSAGIPSLKKTDAYPCSLPVKQCSVPIFCSFISFSPCSVFCIWGQPRTKKAWPLESLVPSKVSFPHHGPSVDFLTHLDSCNNADK